MALLACACLGAVMTPVPPMYSAEQLGSVFASAHARAVIATGEGREVDTCATAVRAAAQALLCVVPDAAAVARVSVPSLALTDLLAAPPLAHTPVAGDALALLVYSSGTTGQPKGVMHSANTARHAIAERVRLHRIEPGEPSLVVAQFGFVGSIVFGHLLGALNGLCTILQKSWNADQALNLIAEHRVSYVLMMPTHVHDVLSSPLLGQVDTGTLRRAAMGGLTEEQRRTVAARVAKPLPAYGLSECLGFTSCDRDAPDAHWLTSEGLPFAGTEVRIADDADQVLPLGSTGHILVRGPSRCLGYLGAPALNAAAFTADGFYRTGDVGHLDGAGCVHFVARAKDIIRRGGVTIVPGDLEAVLIQHPRIAHAAVVGLPDPRLGERACACLVTRDGQPLELDELTGYLESRGVARYTWPESTAVFESFPRSASLKVQKPALVEVLLGRGA